MQSALDVEGFKLQATPSVLVLSIPGRWLLAHATTSWRIKDPEKGFQRVVKEVRARQIAMNVLEQGRTFPNALVLSTNVQSFKAGAGEKGFHLPGNLKFLVVDGQHRLWAQHFATKEANYACVVHLGLDEPQMARLFLEINDNQKRVPSSLRWDLVRLVRPNDDPNQIAAADIVYELATSNESPLFQRIDLTGEQPEIGLKQSSIAPEVKLLVSSKRGPLVSMDLDERYDLIVKYLTALRSYDSAAWRSGSTPFMKARVFRALLKVLPDVAALAKKQSASISTPSLIKIIKKIDATKLSTEEIKALQGSAGIKEIQDLLKKQIEA